MTKKLMLICQIVLLVLVISGCRSNAPPDNELTGSDIGVYYIDGEDGEYPVGIDGKPISGYELDEDGKLIKDGKNILPNGQIDAFIASKSVDVDIGGPDISVDINTAMKEQFEIPIIGKLVLHPATATSKNVTISSSDPSVLYFGNKKSNLTLTVNDKGEAQFSVTFRNIGKSIISVFDTSSETVLYSQEYTIKAAELDSADNITSIGGTQQNTTTSGKVTPPVVIQSPVSTTVVSRSSVVFTAKATDTIGYEWYAKSPDNGAYIKASQLDNYFYNIEISGFETDTLIIGKVPKGLDGWQFRCLFTNAKGVTFSGEAKLTVIAGEEGDEMGGYLESTAQSVILPPHIHDYTAEIVPPTFIEKGYTIYSCSCGDTYTADYVEPIEHIHSYTSTNTGGKIIYTCVECGFSYSE